MCPVDWEPSGDDFWWIQMRCGECEVWIETVIGNRAAAALDVELDYQQAQMAFAARQWDALRMNAEIETFVAALERDLVDATDFAREPRREMS
jgi:hypothetical protein